MNTRIKEVRTDAGVNQESFAESIGLTKNYISLVENGARVPSTRTLKSICEKYGVNENWLLNGEGDKYVKKPKSREIAEFLNEIIILPDESFKKRLILSLSRLEERDFEVLEKIIQKIQ